MKLIIKNGTEFCNVLYGDKEDYSYIVLKGTKKILKEKIEHLQKIYETIDEDEVGVAELYSLGDIINLLDELSENVEMESK